MTVTGLRGYWEDQKKIWSWDQCLVTSSPLLGIIGLFWYSFAPVICLAPISYNWHLSIINLELLRRWAKRGSYHWLGLIRSSMRSPGLCHIPWKNRYQQRIYLHEEIRKTKVSGWLLHASVMLTLLPFFVLLLSAGLGEVGDSPGWETSQFGSRLDPALFSITTNYLITTEPN